MTENTILVAFALLRYNHSGFLRLILWRDGFKRTAARMIKRLLPAPAVRRRIFFIERRKTYGHQRRIGEGI